MKPARPRKGRRAFFALLAIVCLAFAVRYASRFLFKPVPLQIVVLDKTVPDRSFREHKALFNVIGTDYLNTLTGEYFDPERDYYGFVPLPGETYAIRPLPSRFDGTDLFYLTDAYGVYTLDFFGRNPEGERSERIYGGLTLSDIAAIQRAQSAGALFIAEFNTFASPTADPARDAIAAILGVRWTGWIGRHFTNLVRDGEVPAWAIRNYERQYASPWNFSGPGYLLVCDDRIVVLREGPDIAHDGCVFELSGEGLELFPEVRTAPYLYWFDILEPLEHSTVLATFTLDVSDNGAAVLQRAGIPASFPAIILHQQPTTTALYFAGDFADRDDRFVFLRSDRESLFYRRVYEPMMEVILARVAEHRGRREPIQLIRAPGVDTRTIELSPARREDSPALQENGRDSRSRQDSHVIQPVR